MQKLTNICSFVGLILFGANLFAALPPLTDEMRSDRSQYILSGEAIGDAVEYQSDYLDRKIIRRYYRAPFHVTGIEKAAGNEILMNKVINVTYHKYELPRGMVGGTGQRSSMRQGQQYKIYVGAMSNKDYELLSPNGMDLVRDEL